MAALAAAPSLMRTAPWADYALVDSGGGRKLERFGPYLTIRPEAQCLWRPALPVAGRPAGDQDHGTPVPGPGCRRPGR